MTPYRSPLFVYAAKLRSLFCRHEWKVSKFQALVLGTTSYRCAKCGKFRSILR